MDFLGRRRTRDPEPLGLDSDVLGAILAHVSIEDAINFGRTDQSNRKAVKSLELVKVANGIETLVQRGKTKLVNGEYAGIGQLDNLFLERFKVRGWHYFVYNKDRHFASVNDRRNYKHNGKNVYYSEAPGTGDVLQRRWLTVYMYQKLPAVVSRDNLSTLAAAYGRLDWLKVLLKNDFPMTDHCLPAAAGAGHLDIVEWLWNGSVDHTGYGPSAMSMSNQRWWISCFLTEIREYAAAGGHSHILEWTMAVQTREDWQWWCSRGSDSLRLLSSLACASGDIKTVQWLVSQPLLKIPADVWVRSVQNLDLDVMKFLWQEKGLLSPWHLAFNGTHLNETTRERIEDTDLGFDDNIWERGFDTVVKHSAMSDGWSSQKVVDVLQWLWEQGLAPEAHGHDLEKEFSFGKRSDTAPPLVYRWGIAHGFTEPSWV
jgi:hypothetical protein